MSSNMFTNFFGKGFKKFANIFFKNGVTSLDINKDANQTILNNIANNKPDDICLMKNYNQINTNGENLNPLHKYSWNWEENERKKEELELEFQNKNKIFPSSTNFNQLVSDFRSRIKNSENGLSSNGEELVANKLRNRVCEAQVTANSPREDRNNAIQLRNIDGYFLSVLDGHGGDDVAEFAVKTLHKKFDEKYLEYRDDFTKNKQEKIKIAIEYSFAQIEKEFYTEAYNKYKNGEGRYAYVGTCVLCVVVHDNNLYVANLGDSKARLFRKKIEQINNKIEISYTPIKITTTHNAGKYYEQKRLREKFKDVDIIVDKGVACYVKGRLQPTKTLGDFYLKHKEFNEPPQNVGERFLKRVIDNFNGPYIENIPDVQNYELTEDDEFLVLATDGLWDWLSAQEVADIISATSKDKSKIADTLCREALTKAGKKANLDIEQVKHLPAGVKRSIHDDISLLVVDLKNQVSYKNKIKQSIKDI